MEVQEQEQKEHPNKMKENEMMKHTSTVSYLVASSNERVMHVQGPWKQKERSLL